MYIEDHLLEPSDLADLGKLRALRARVGSQSAFLGGLMELRMAHLRDLYLGNEYRNWAVPDRTRQQHEQRAVSSGLFDVCRLSAEHFDYATPLKLLRENLPTMGHWL